MERQLGYQLMTKRLILKIMSNSYLYTLIHLLLVCLIVVAPLRYLKIFKIQKMLKPCFLMVTLILRMLLEEMGSLYYQKMG